MTDTERELLANYEQLNKVGALPKSDQADYDNLKAMSLGLNSSQDQVKISGTPHTDPNWYDAAKTFVTGIDSRIQSGLDAANEFALPTIAPMLGQIAGAGLGSLAGPPGIIAGEALGGGLGEGFNQLTGITEPSLLQIGLATAASPIGRAIPPAARYLARFLPGAEAAKHILNSRAATKLKDLFLPNVSSKSLFSLADKLTVPIEAVPKTKAIIGQLLEEQATLAPNLRDLNFIKRGEDFLSFLPSGSSSQPGIFGPTGMPYRPVSSSSSIPFNDLLKNIQGLGEVVGNMSETKQLSARRMKMVYGALVSDLKDLTKSPIASEGSKYASALYETAVNAFKQELAGKAYDDALQTALTSKIGQQSFDPNVLVEALRKDEVFSVVDKVTHSEIVKTLETMARRTSEIGGPKAIDRYLAGKTALLLGGAGAVYYYGDPKLGAGIALGVWGSGELIKRALLHPVGRDFLVGPLMKLPVQSQSAALAQFLVSGRMFDTNKKSQRLLPYDNNSLNELFTLPATQ